MDQDGFEYFTLRDKPELKDAAAEWFHGKWGVPKEAYLECMESYLNNDTEYGWYLCTDGDKIVGGLGVIENDFHDRKDLRSKEISPVYLVTDHTGFYERYGWEFLCMVQGDGEPEMTRMYIHR